MSFAEIHVWWAWVVVIGNGVSGAWHLLAHYRPAVRGPVLWWVTIVAQVSLALEVVFGVLVMQVDGREVEQLHVVYGFVSLAALGILYSYRLQIERWQYLLYGFGGLFLMGMGIRELFLTGT